MIEYMMHMKELFVVKRFFISSITLLIFLIFLVPQTHAATFTFTAAGDYDGNSNTNTVLNGIKNSGAQFNIAVGDFRYDSQSSPAGWNSYVQGIVGASFPFELISGNHDASSIDQYTASMPDRIGGIVGQYGKEYYFDYPPSSPIARFILTAPNEIYSYPAGSTHYNFVSTAIDDARAKGIKWVIAGMHKNCITSATKSCEIGADLMNLLINKRVDLVLQGHDHNLQRSKQLTCAVINSYNSSCVANAGSSLTKGAGTVFIIVGTGGQGLYSINSGDPENQYFAATNSNGFGFAKIVVTDTQLSYTYVRTAGSSFSDSMTITGTGGVTTPPSPTTPIIPSPTSLPAGSTTLSFQVNLHGIGKGGDNVNPTATGNMNPIITSRAITVTLSDANGIDSVHQGTIQYNSTLGNYQATVPVSSTIATGPYLAQVKVTRYLSKRYPGIVTITKGQIIQLPLIALIAGDSNGDNALSVLDYNLILDCFSDLSPARNCTIDKKAQTDLNDDGNVNQFDYNLFLRELSVQSGA